MQNSFTFNEGDAMQYNQIMNRSFGTLSGIVDEFRIPSNDDDLIAFLRDYARVFEIVPGQSLSNRVIYRPKLSDERLDPGIRIIANKYPEQFTATGQVSTRDLHGFVQLYPAFTLETYQTFKQFKQERARMRTAKMGAQAVAADDETVGAGTGTRKRDRE